VPALREIVAVSLPLRSDVLRAFNVSVPVVAPAAIENFVPLKV
jgi:hypothetical protein